MAVVGILFVNFIFVLAINKLTTIEVHNRRSSKALNICRVRVWGGGAQQQGSLYHTWGTMAM